ncbi:MAG: patatin-like phospholipase family protein, partial [Nitratireductor sp.]|nr:patatin-like phospholipase family protein [Nitratireductor sp.]
MKEVALVLGGGGARGIAHIHVLRAFDDLGIKPCVIAGTSIGSVMGAGYAAGMSGDEIADYAVQTFSKRAEVMGRLWRLRPESFGAAIFGGTARMGEFNAQKVVRAFLPQSIPERFEDLAIPLKVTATDFFASTLTVLEKGDLVQAIAASSALPVLFRPEIIDGRVHVDGGFANPVPFDIVTAPGRLVVAVDVVGMPRGRDRNMPTRVEAAFGASQLLMHSITRLMLDKHKPDLLI